MVSVLEREMFSEAEAARLLRVPQSTLHYWLDGGQRRGRRYKPVIRIEPRSARSVTWAEFVEAGLLREYRREHRVPMPELRAFIDLLRRDFGVPYPLADRRPYVVGRQLVLDAQSAAGLDPEFWLVAAVSGQLLLTPPSAAFVERVTWEGDVAAGWRPDPNPESPVRILPGVRFGRPSIRGISTEAIWEQVDVGEDVAEVADLYGLEVGDVRWALAYENSQRGVSRVKPAEVRYYVDADMVGLGHVLARLRPDVTYPGDVGGVVHKRERPSCPVGSVQTADDVWIPEVARRGWLIITRDRHIREHRREMAAVREHGARMVALVGEDTRGTFAQLEVVMCQWRSLQRTLDEPGPFIYAATRTRLTPVALD